VHSTPARPSTNNTLPLMSHAGYSDELMDLFDSQPDLDLCILAHREILVPNDPTLAVLRSKVINRKFKGTEGLVAFTRAVSAWDADLVESGRISESVRDSLINADKLAIAAATHRSEKLGHILKSLRRSP
jgi:hypothetical protein